MLRSLPLRWAVPWCLGAGMVSAQEVAFQSAALPQGSVVQGIHHAEMRIRMPLPPSSGSPPPQGSESFEMRSLSDQICRVEILPPDRASLTYAKDVESVSTMQGDEEIKRPTNGKGYLVAKGPDGWIVTAQGEGTVAPEERDLVLRDCRDLLGDSLLAPLLTRAPLSPGTVLEISGSTAAALLELDAGEQADLKQLTLTLQGTREAGGTPCGVFAASALLESSGSGTAIHETMAMQLTGEILICTRTCRLVHSFLKGTIALQSSQGAVERTGDGEVVIERRFDLQ